MQGPKSYNDALAKRFERKKGDMGSSSTGVKDRGIFVSADFRNPRTDQELQVHRCFLRQTLCIMSFTYQASFSLPLLLELELIISQAHMLEYWSW